MVSCLSSGLLRRRRDWIEGEQSPVAFIGLSSRSRPRQLTRLVLGLDRAASILRSTRVSPSSVPFKLSGFSEALAHRQIRGNRMPDGGLESTALRHCAQKQEMVHGFCNAANWPWPYRGCRPPEICLWGCQGWQDLPRADRGGRCRSGRLILLDKPTIDDLSKNSCSRAQIVVVFNLHV